MKFTLHDRQPLLLSSLPTHLTPSLQLPICSLSSHILFDIREREHTPLPLLHYTTVQSIPENVLKGTNQQFPFRSKKLRPFSSLHQLFLFTPLSSNKKKKISFSALFQPHFSIFCLFNHSDPFLFAEPFFGYNWESWFSFELRMKFCIIFS